MTEEYSCRERAHRLARLVAEAYLGEGCDCLLLSGGIDTSFIALSLALNGVKPKTITVVYNKESIDYPYTVRVSRKLGLDNILVMGGGETDVCLARVLEIFRTIDPVEVVCDIPICMGLTEAKRQGCRCIMTGDGGDELFFGYTFLLDKETLELEEWVNYVIGKRFSSEILGEHIGLKTIPAFYHRKVKEYSLDVPYNCKIGIRGKRKWGKLLLREFLEEHGLEEIAWREKTPVNIGSGFNKLLRRWSNSISLIEALKLYSESLIHFPSKPHAYLYSRIVKAGIGIPNKCGDERKTCPICSRCIDGRHCSFCGASISSDRRVMVYSDELYHEIRRVMST